MPARFSALVIVAAFSGLRWGEQVALRRCDVDIDAGTVRVPRKLAVPRNRTEFGPPKTEAGRRPVVLPSAARTVLVEHLGEHVAADPDALIFTGDKGAVLRTGNFRRAVKWTDALKAAGMPTGFHFHDLRHTGNNLAAATGASTRDLMHRMGHAVLIYQHATSERDREIADGMDRRIARQRRPSKDVTKKARRKPTKKGRAADDDPARPD